MSDHWFTKTVRYDMLDSELNAFHNQGYAIRWLFRGLDTDGQSDYFVIVAEYLHL